MKALRLLWCSSIMVGQSSRQWMSLGGGIGTLHWCTKNFFFYESNFFRSPDNQGSFWTIQCELALSSSETQSKLWKEIKYKFGFGLVYITMQTEFRKWDFLTKIWNQKINPVLRNHLCILEIVRGQGTISKYIAISTKKLYLSTTELNRLLLASKLDSPQNYAMF